MNPSSLTRRQFAGRLGGGLLAAAAFGGRPMSALSAEEHARFELLDSEGRPLPPEDRERFYACDLRVRPIPIQPSFHSDQVDFAPPSRPFRVSVPLRVPGFGHVYVYADDEGRGYTKARFSRGQPLLLSYEAAASRLSAAQALHDSIVQGGTAVPRATAERLTLARRLLDEASQAREKHAKIRNSYESLRESLWAGEELVLVRARAAISRRGPRPGFLFGANTYHYVRYRRPYVERFEGLFNYATLPFYFRSTRPAPDRVDYSRAEQILEWIGSTPLACKGHPLIFFYQTVTPDWLREREPDEARRICLDYVRNSILRFRDRIHVWDVVNELHDQNELGFSKEELVELTGDALRAAREADPTCFRIVNNCCPWCEYLARDVPRGKQSIYDYLGMLRDRDVDYEAIGLQYYYYGRDLLEIERSLETFADFGKPVHITELGVPSSSEEIPTQWPHGVRFPWHGDRWSETMQADWAEQFYTMAYSKPYVEAISWWDLAEPAFIPHGGLIMETLRPKESYYRLQRLLTRWRT